MHRFVAPDCFRARAVRLVAAFVLAGAVLGCGNSPAAAPTCTAGSEGCTSILFLGNSYTYVNNLPDTFARLADSGSRRVNAQMIANGSETLMQHAQAAESLDKIASTAWNYVMLQEQSQTPATAYGREQTASAVQLLARKAGAIGARTMLFLTPAHRDGMPEASLPDYASMQRAIDDGYLSVARRLDKAIVPAGYVWFLVRERHAEISLWQDDGSHPTIAGTYLEACVFYAAIFHQPSAGLGYLDGLPADQARILQSAADDNVLPSLHEWGLDL